MQVTHVIHAFGAVYALSNPVRDEHSPFGPAMRGYYSLLVSSGGLVCRYPFERHVGLFPLEPGDTNLITL